MIRNTNPKKTTQKARVAKKPTSLKLKKSTKLTTKRAMTSTADLKHALSMHDAFVPPQRRTFRQWQNKPVSVDVVKKAYDTIKYGPTAFNSSPLRMAILSTTDAKEKFVTTLLPGNVDPMKTAPITVVLAWDSQFNDHFDFLSPGYAGAGEYFKGNPNMVEPAGKLNATLQAGYLIAALRTQGLDLGPANGFDNAAADQVLFSGNDKTKSWKSFMYVNIGHAVPDSVFPRGPRFDFETASHVV